MWNDYDDNNLECDRCGKLRDFVYTYKVKEFEESEDVEVVALCESCVENLLSRGFCLEFA